MARGRKPDPEKVVPFKNENGVPHEDQCARLAADLKPVDLSEAEGAVWDRLAPQMALLGRLKSHYVDVIENYCVAVVRLKAIRRELLEEGETYIVEGRNGAQEKSKPQVAQYNETFRQWRALVGELYLSPAAERMLAGQGDLFPEQNPFSKLGGSS
ncbi:P27 family phage terminase small subunit [Cohaesibacter celericrescens]|uniref:Terminase n=1 Tax=Cohaesibacter celericrescens TaxID=2067669 RepID=A0A2N5XQN3_9HYPH|nr:P27 family phage terminase small subunit [Cohaesibacter celericrescens]PLW76813.1 terminase [Cohaesibacter celericrescens]